MYAGAAKTDVTPASPVWMDGMIRTHRSHGVHDPLFARCLVLAGQTTLDNAFAIVAVDVCALGQATCAAARHAVAALTGLPAGHIIIAATHSHSGPATFGFFNPREEQYNRWLIARIAEVVAIATHDLAPVAVAYGSGREETISHYRRLLADDGQVVMNWEPYDPDYLRGPLGVADPEVGVLKLTWANKPDAVVAVLFSHSGHPNVMSGDNYLLSSEYPGRAARLVEEQLGGTAVFINGAEGSVDIEHLRDRDWEGVERRAQALAQAVAGAAVRSAPPGSALIGQTVTYSVPARKITEQEWAWAQDVLRRTGGAVQAMPDGVGDDYLALLYRELRGVENQDVTIGQTCLAVGDWALISFPGELYTEIGMTIKAHSPFRHTCTVGLANGYVGYVPTSKAIQEGGYAEDTRRLDAVADDIVLQQSLSLLHSVRAKSTRGES